MLGGLGMSLIIGRDDIVINSKDNRKGVVKSIYRELNIAIVEFANSTEKVTLDNLIVLKAQDSGEHKSRNIFKKLMRKVKKLIHRFRVVIK